MLFRLPANLPAAGTTSLSSISPDPGPGYGFKRIDGSPSSDQLRITAE